MAPAIPLDEYGAPRGYEIQKQRVDLDIDFPTRSLKGSTEITVQPTTKELRVIRLQCRQAKVTQVQVGGITARWDYDDPYRVHVSAKSTVHQHAMLKDKVGASVRPSPEAELTITLPPKLKIQEIQGDAAVVPQQESEAAETPMLEKAQQFAQTFAPIKLTVEFEVEIFRDGVHWIGCEEADKRYPHLYTKLEPWAGNTSSIFPCVDDATTRSQWEIAIRCPRTLGDAFRRPQAAQQLHGESVAASDGDVEMVDDTDDPAKAKETQATEDFLIDLNEEDAALELSILCVGNVMEDIADTDDDSRHTVTYSLNDAVAARHIGFAIGPFESVDLTSTRTADEEEKLAATAVKVEAFCLPGRVEELQNTCFPICQAVDHLSVHCGRFSFPSYQMLFVDDTIHETSAAAGLSICSTRLLFPEEIIEPIDQNTRILVRAVADQWSGVNIIPREPADAWAVAGIAGYLTDVFMKKLSGNNQYRWEQKLASEKVYDLDVDRPSIQTHGSLLHLDPSIREFLNLKSALVLGILDRRLIKSSGSTGVMRIINKILLNAKTGTLHNGALSTAEFQRTCEKLGHNKLEHFFRQWVQGAGCPIFYVTQRFNKKKLVVEMEIRQRQHERQTKPLFAPNNFMREVKEHVREVWAGELQPVFTGPMTIRIHEADGTPYEHIVEIKEGTTKLEIPYNTKYKRLKRSRRQRERAAAEGQANGENTDEALLYCLGDVLDRPEDMKEWNLMDWSKEDEDKMGGESYEWIRMDADFEWLGRIHLTQPLYMYISQLQQDRDIVAQHESMRHLCGAAAHHVSLSILLRTLMDERYFYGIRILAAEGLASLARGQLLKIGQMHLTKAFAEMFCEEDGVMPRPNDFTSRVAFIMQCAIPRAMTKLRDDEGKVPKAVEQFFVDKLKFNDNSDNLYSDCHYVSTLMTCLAESLVVSHRIIRPTVAPTYEFNFGEEEPVEEEEQEEFNPDADFEQMAIDEIERYRRIDEWVVTYQNIYSTTAIRCLQKLTKAGVVKDKTKELLQYTRPSTADNVRLEAFGCLNEIGLTRRMPVMKHLIFNLVEDRSPYVRDRLMTLLGEALGHIALGDDPIEKPEAAPPAADGLIVDEGASNEAKRIEATRKTTTEGALAALKMTLRDSEVFKHVVWHAATSPDITLDETAAFCDIAALIYDAVTSFTVLLRLPRPYKCANHGKGKMHFFQQGAYRTKPGKGLPLEDYESLEHYGLKYSGPLGEDTQRAIAKKAEDAAAAAAALKIRIANTQQQMAAQTAAASMPPPATIPTPITEKSGFKLSLAGPKRKPSVDIREASPKAMKMSKTSTPGSFPPRKPSASGKSKLVVLSLGISASRKAQQIMTSAVKPASYPAGVTVPSRAATPHTPSILPNPTSLSPQASFSATTPTPPVAPLNLNVGGFRSFDLAAANPFGPSGDSISPAPTSSFAGSPPPPPSVTSLTGGGIMSLTSLSAKSASPPAAADSAISAPPKPKLKLKLGSRQNSIGGGQGSPPE